VKAQIKDTTMLNITFEFLKTKSNDMRKLIRQLIKESLIKESDASIDLDKIGNDLVLALKQAGFKKAKKGRGHVDNYGPTQNKDVFLGPFKNDIYKHFKLGQELGKYFLNVYKKPDDKLVFDAYVATVNNARFTKSLAGFVFPEGALTIFEMHKKYVELVKSKNKNAKHYKVVSRSTIREYLLKMFNQGNHRLSNLESYWVERASSSTKYGIGTHLNGGALDLIGYDENTSKEDLASIKKIVKTIAAKNGTSLKQFVVEADHIHLGFKV